jgi:Tol biopolymer transport system component
VTNKTLESADAFVFDPATARVLQVTQGEWQLSISSPIGWLPDGQSLYLMASNAVRKDQRLVVVKVDSGGSHVIPNFPSSDVSTVVASPDGAWFLWTSKNNAYLSSATDANAKPRQLLDEQMPIFYPTWSPDSRRIAFAAQQPNAESLEVYLVPVDGGTLEAATALQAERPNDAPFALYDLSWSPDGSRIAFVSRFGEDPDQKYEICAVTLSPRSTRCFDSVDGFRPIWLSDNRVLLFRSSGGGICKLDTATGEVFALTHDPSDSIVRSGPISPDSQFLLFWSKRDYWLGEIYILHIDSGQIVARVTSGFDGYSSAAWSPK